MQRKGWLIKTYTLVRPIGEIIGHIESEQKDETGEQLNLIRQLLKVYRRITKGLEPGNTGIVFRQVIFFNASFLIGTIIFFQRDLVSWTPNRPG